MAYKLVLFDLDGTIIDEIVFIWQTIHDYLGTDQNVRDEYRQRFLNKEITYDEWAVHDIEMWKSYGATKKQLMAAIEPLKLMNGALETIKELKKRGLKLAIVSGSLNIALEKVLPDYEQYFDDVFINYIDFNIDGTIKGVKSTDFDFEHKAKALRVLCERENIEPEECVFVGDHDNDVHIAEKAGLAIAFNSKSEKLNKVCDVVIKEKDLRKVLEHIK